MNIFRTKQVMGVQYIQFDTIDYRQQIFIKANPALDKNLMREIADECGTCPAKLYIQAEHYYSLLVSYDVKKMKKSAYVPAPVGFQPFEEAVNAALVDVSDEVAQVYRQKLEHWIVRGWKILRLTGIIKDYKKAFLPVDPTTKIAVLPKDWSGEFSTIGYVNEANLVIPFGYNPNLSAAQLIDDPTEPDDCECECECGCTDTLPKEVKYELLEEEVVIAGNTYVKTTKKMILPDGTYIVEVTQPVFEGAAVVFETTTEEKCKVEVKDCGCVLATPDNITTLCACGCTCVFSGCGSLDNIIPINHLYEGYYNIFEDLGYIQFNPNFCYDKIYVKYRGDLPCFKGVYLIPEDAFEALVAFGVMKFHKSRFRSSSEGDKERAEKDWKSAKKDVMKPKTRMSITKIIESLGIAVNY